MGTIKNRHIPDLYDPAEAGLQSGELTNIAATTFDPARSQDDLNLSPAERAERAADRAAALIAAGEDQFDKQLDIKLIMGILDRNSAPKRGSGSAQSMSAVQERDAPGTRKEEDKRQRFLDYIFILQTQADLYFANAESLGDVMNLFQNARDLLQNDPDARQALNEILDDYEQNGTIDRDAAMALADKLGLDLKDNITDEDLITILQRVDRFSNLSEHEYNDVMNAMKRQKTEWEEKGTAIAQEAEALRKRIKDIPDDKLGEELSKSKARVELLDQMDGDSQDKRKSINDQLQNAWNNQKYEASTPEGMKALLDFKIG